MDVQKRTRERVLVFTFRCYLLKKYIKDTCLPSMLTMLDMEKLLMSKRTDMVSVGGFNIILAVSIT